MLGWSFHRLKRPGLSRVEILVVLTIVGVLLALVLAGLQPVYVVGRRAKCAFQLRAVGLGLLHYAIMHPKGVGPDAKGGQFPPGTLPNPALPPNQRLSWVVEVLPYLEDDKPSGQIGRTAPWDAAVNLPAVQTPIRILRCPNWDPESEVTPAYVTSYLGVAGVGADAALLPPGDRRAGIFGYDRQTALSDIKDGTSHTLLLLESIHNDGPWAQGGPATVRGLEPADRPYLGPGRPFGGMHHQGEKVALWIRRPLGCNVLMADGSSRFVRNDIASEVLEALATIAGSEHIGDDW